jgi:hypothetical protein
MQAVINKTLYAPDFGFIRFSFTQLVILLKGFRSFINVFNSDTTPKVLKFLLDRAQHLLTQKDFYDIMKADDDGKLNFIAILRYDNYIGKGTEK